MHNWTTILKRQGRPITAAAKKMIDGLMADGKARTPRQVIEDLHKEVERKNKPTQYGKYQGRKAGFLSGSYIPLLEDTKYYLSINYQKAGRETRAGLQEGKIKYIKKAEAGDVIFGNEPPISYRQQKREGIGPNTQTKKDVLFAVKVLHIPLRVAKGLSFPSNFNKLLELNAKDVSDEDFFSLLQRVDSGQDHQKIIDDFVEMLKGNYASSETPKELPKDFKLKSILKNVNYSAVVLDDESRNYLLSLPMPEGWKPFAHHMTITLGALVHPKGKHDFSENYSVGDKVTLPIIAIGRDDRAMAVKVKAEGTNLKHTKFPHITVAINPDGGKPFHSQKIPEENFKPHTGTLTGIVTEVKQ